MKVVLIAIGAACFPSFIHGFGNHYYTRTISPSSRHDTALGVSTSNIGLGPEPQKEEDDDERELVAGVDYQIPDHESYRTSRRSKLDEECDAWFGKLLGVENGILQKIAQDTRTVLTTPVELVNDVKLDDINDPEWTPYVTTRLPWTPLVPAFGLEEYGLPIPRRNAETWRHFDVAGMVHQDYSGSCFKEEMDDTKIEKYKKSLIQNGGWLNDEDCTARLVYINGQFCSELSKTTENCYNMDSLEGVDEETCKYLARLTDGFTDELAVPVPSGESDFLTQYSKLSGPDHNMGNATSQFAINVQQGTACFAALNTIRTNAVAYIRHTKTEKDSKPVLLVNAVTASGGAASSDSDEGVACHPRALVIAEENSTLSLVQSCVDLDTANDDDDKEESRPKLYNGYTQIFIKAGANVTHSYLEESGGLVTSGVEQNDNDLAKGVTPPREIEAHRPQLQDTLLEAIEVQAMGDSAGYIGTLMGIGGSGRVRVALSVSLLKPESFGHVNGFMLTGGAQRGDMRTNIHHVAQGTISRQTQKNMVGGRATAAFRGRIRVEQSAQQTDSQQLSRTVLLSDRSRIWTVPSLEIIADDVVCTHGATVSDLSEEELFYLRSRGLDRAMARNLLMYGFVVDICENVEPAMLGSVDGREGLQKRMIQRLENVAPQGERAIKGEFQSV